MLNMIKIVPIRIFSIIVVSIVASIAVSCFRSQKQAHALSDIENLAHTNPDSALILLNDIDISELEEDSLKRCV